MEGYIAAIHVANRKHTVLFVTSTGITLEEKDAAVFRFKSEADTAAAHWAKPGEVRGSELVHREPNCRLCIQFEAIEE